MNCTNASCSSIFSTQSVPSKLVISASVIGTLALVLIVAGVSLHYLHQSSYSFPLMYSGGGTGALSVILFAAAYFSKRSSKDSPVTIIDNSPDASWATVNIFFEIFKSLSIIIPDSAQIKDVSSEKLFKNDTKTFSDWPVYSTAECAKFRYKNIRPYRENALVDFEGNVIGASRLPGGWIASQGPLPDDVSFWQGMWEQDVSLVVMLTNFSEYDEKEQKDVEKCSLYFPLTVNGSLVWEDFSVTCSTIEEEKNLEGTNEKIIERTLVLKKGADQKVIKHWHITTWKDKTAIEPEGLIQLQEKIHQHRIQHPHKQVTCHCSAGIGRTGTLIVFDLVLRLMPLIKQSKLGLNLSSLIRQLRNDKEYGRMGLVQTQEQYDLIIRALGLKGHSIGTK